MIRKIEIPVKSKIYEMLSSVYSHTVNSHTGEALDLEMAFILPKIRSGMKRPVILWLPGGAWMECNPWKRMPSLMFFAERGYIVTAAQYRLCTQAPYPAQIEDAKTAVRFLRANAAQYGADPNRIGVIGCSAGGLLASMVAMNEDTHYTDEWSGFSSGVSAAADLYGPSDLSALEQAVSGTPAAKAVFEARRLLIGEHHEQIAEKLRDASPIYHINSNTCPILIAHGTNDQIIPLSQGELFYKALQKGGVESELYLLEGAGHSTPEFMQEEFKQIMLGFFNKHL
jgi:acetyl esterase/lipase